MAFCKIAGNEEVLYRFFVEENQISDKTITIMGDDAHHIKNVLRLKIGEEISVSNGVDDRDFRCGIKAYQDDVVICELRFIKESGNELASRVFLFQGLPKGDKMEAIIQKCVELGVYEIIPVSMKRCVVKLDDKKSKSKVIRWQAISEAAAKQSKRSIVPAIKPPMSMKVALEYSKEMGLKLLPYELADGMSRTKEIIDNIEENQDIAIFIGPEGGFDETEVSDATSMGFNIITLGKRILRTETAGMTLMSWIMYKLEK